MIKKINLKRTIILLAVLLVVISVGSTTLLMTLSTQQIIYESISREKNQLIAHSENVFDDFISSQLSNIDRWSVQPVVSIHFTIPGLGNLSLPGIKSYFSKIGVASPWIDSIHLIQGSEITLAYSRLPVNGLYDLPSRILAETSEKSILSVAADGQRVQSTKILIKRELPDDAGIGRFIAVVIDPNQVQRHLFADERIGNTGLIVLAIQTPSGGFWVPEVNGGEFEAGSKILDLYFSEVSNWQSWQDIGSNSSEFQIIPRKLKFPSVGLLSVIPINELKSPIVSQVETAFVLGALIVLAGGVVAIYLTTLLHKPLFQFISNIEGLEFDQSEPKKFPYQHSVFNEIEQLNVAFRGLFNRISKSNLQLVESEKQLRNLFESNEVAMFNEDFSLVFKHLDQFRQQGIKDLRAHLNANKNILADLTALIKLNSVNDRAVRLFNAKSKSDFSERNGGIIKHIAPKIFSEMLIGFWEDDFYFRTNTSIRTFDGELITVILSMPIPKSDSEMSMVPVSLIDITEQKAAEKALKSSEEKYRFLVETAPICIFQLDATGTVVSMNETGLKMCRFDEEIDAIGLPFETFASAADSDRVREIIEDTQDDRQADFEFSGASGYEFSCKLVNIPDLEGGVHRILGIAQDITIKKHSIEKLNFQASHDALTGLLNRREFENRVSSLLDSISEERSEHALLFLDLDQFKIVNDTSGHVAGDELLKQVSFILSEAVRKHDTLSRLGGDEFGILMEHCTLLESRRTANEILEAILAHHFVWEGKTYRIGVSIGLVAVTEMSGSFTDLFKQADSACYMAKDLGRNRIHEYHPDDTELAIRHGEMQWVGKIHQALEEDRFCLFAQPIVSLKTGGLKHYELLIRMLDEENAVIAPSQFLPAAERYNLMERIDSWVVKNAIRLMNDHKSFLDEASFISINLSGQSVANAQFMRQVIELITSSEVDSQKLCFEITETAAISNLVSARSFISVGNLQVRTMDELLAGDMRGHLQSSITDGTYFLKIDGSFIKEMGNSQIDKALVKSINDIGHVMGMRTIAEFVETESIVKQLKEIGVDYAQGYHIGKPEVFIEIAGDSS